MMVPTEVDITLALPPASLARLKRLPLMRTAGKNGKSETEVAVYFDTDKRRLHRKGLTLKVRRVGKRHVQTIKATGSGGRLAAREWESEIADEKPDLDRARGTALEPLLGRNLGRKLQPMFETRARRTTYPLGDGKGSIALTVDKGRIDTGRRSQALCEIALHGSEAGELFALAREIAQAVPAQLALKSKSERGYGLLEGSDGAATHAAPIDLPVGTSTRDSFRIIAHACLAHALGNEQALLAGDPDGVHQMRVGVRRLRAAMSLFADILGNGETAAIKRELRWLAGELARARELDVLVSRVLAPVKRRHSRLDGVASLSHDLAERRAEALARAQDAVRSARFRALAVDIVAWLETGQWTRPHDDLVRERGDVAIELAAAAELDRRWRKVRKKGRRLTELDPPARHKLRIGIKKIRYATEFYASLFAGKRASRRREKFRAALEQMQDRLGELNDIVVHEGLMATIARQSRPGRRGGRKRAFAAGLVSGREDARLDAEFAAAVEAYAVLAKVKPFWR